MRTAASCKFDSKISPLIVSAVFPDANEITPHAVAFAQMMFAHAAFEREVRSLLDAVTAEEGFGERPNNQWKASVECVDKVIRLIEKHRGNHLPQTAQIKALLEDAIQLYRQRNFLVHGTWWCFNRRTLIITVRGGVRWEDPKEPPEQRDYTASDIRELTDKFKDIEAELFKLRHAFEPQKTEAEIRGELGS